MKKLIIVAALCASSALAYAGAGEDQTPASKAQALVLQQALPTLPQSALNAPSGDAFAHHAIPRDLPRFGDQPVATRVVGHQDVEVGDQKVALSISEERYAGGYVSECKQYVKSFEHHIVTESDAWGSSNLPTDETTIKLGNRCGQVKKG